MYIHLRLHTEFSVVDGTVRIDEGVKAAAQYGQGALAITDLNNLFATVKFYKDARNYGVKPIVGAEIWLEGFGARRYVSRSPSYDVTVPPRTSHRRSAVASIKWRSWLINMTQPS